MGRCAVVTLVVGLCVMIGGCATSVGDPAFMSRMVETGKGQVVREVPRSAWSEYQRDVVGRMGARLVPDELMALEISYPGGGNGGCIEIVRTGGSGELHYIEEKNYQLRTDRYYSRPFSREEFDQLHDFLAKNRIDQLSRQEFGGFDGVEYRWTHVVGGAAFQVVLNNPGDEGHPAVDLAPELRKFRDAAPLTCIYTTALPENVTLLYAVPLKDVRRVWAMGGDIRALIGEEEMTTEAWFALKEGQWVPSEAPGPAFVEAKRVEPRDIGMVGIGYAAPWKDGQLVMGEDFQEFKRGTFVIRKGASPVKLLDRELEFPLLVPQTNLLLGTDVDHLICYDVEARKQVALADDLKGFQVFDYVPEKKAVLLVRRHVTPYGDESQYPDWRLFDPGTLESKRIEIDYWAQKAYPHPQELQAAAAPGTYWIALPDRTYNRTNIWRLDRSTFKLLGFNRFIVDGLVFDSPRMWIDEKAKVAYVIHDGQLFRVPVPEGALGDE